VNDSWWGWIVKGALFGFGFGFGTAVVGGLIAMLKGARP